MRAPLFVATLLAAVAQSSPDTPDGAPRSNPLSQTPPWAVAFLDGTRALDTRELDRAGALLERSWRQRPTHAASAYQLACVRSLEGDLDDALDLLAASDRLRPVERELVAWDADLATLRAEPRATIATRPRTREARGPGARSSVARTNGR